jgi:hypothetical protein
MRPAACTYGYGERFFFDLIHFVKERPDRQGKR